MEIMCVPVGPLQANCYLVWDDEKKACAVDPGGEPERLAQIVARRGLDLEAILVTHGHFDHVEGVKGLAEATGAKVYCSAAVAPIVGGEKGCPASGYPIASVDPMSVQVVSDGTSFSVGALPVKVIATPGHTPGDVTFDIGGRLFCGDLLFHRSVGRTDFPGGDFARLLASVARLLAMYDADTPVYTGHMQSTTLGDEAAFNPFLSGLGVRG
jgi:glyoxylase-like metal-dependent hydrolase (beta-lactamase superfamily II)